MALVAAQNPSLGMKRKNICARENMYYLHHMRWSANVASTAEAVKDMFLGHKDIMWPQSLS